MVVLYRDKPTFTIQSQFHLRAGSTYPKVAEATFKTKGKRLLVFESVRSLGLITEHQIDYLYSNWLKSEENQRKNEATCDCHLGARVLVFGGRIFIHHNRTTCNRWHFLFRFQNGSSSPPRKCYCWYARFLFDRRQTANHHHSKVSLTRWFNMIQYAKFVNMTHCGPANTFEIMAKIF